MAEPEPGPVDVREGPSGRPRGRGDPYRRAAVPAPGSGPATTYPSSLWAVAGRMSWVAGLVLALSPFMGWYSGGAEEGPPVSVLGWNSGVPGKLVFFAGLAVVCLALLRAAGVELPRALPESLLVVGLGTLATVLVLIRAVSIPDSLVGTGDRAVGLWVALVAAVAVIVCGLLRAGEEL